MIFKAKNGAEIIEKINIDENETIGKFANLNHALVIVKIEENIDEINEKLLEFY